MTALGRIRSLRRCAMIVGGAVVVAIALLGASGQRAGGSTAGASGVLRVGIKGFAYHPPTLRVAKGSAVTFANSDGTAHTATGKGFDAGTIRPGKSVRVRFSRKGSFAYHCTIHPFMHGRIVVG